MSWAYIKTKSVELDKRESRLFGLLESSRSCEEKYSPVMDEVRSMLLEGSVEDVAQLVSILLDRERLVDIFRD